MHLISAVFAQKAEVNKQGKILSDGNVIATIEKDGCGAISTTCSFYVRNDKGELLITVLALEYQDPHENKFC